eukprot:jgi/Bigna1/70374/fgenesh1_pg.11_\
MHSESVTELDESKGFDLYLSDGERVGDNQGVRWNRCSNVFCKIWEALHVPDNSLYTFGDIEGAKWLGHCPSTMFSKISLETKVKTRTVFDIVDTDRDGHINATQLRQGLEDVQLIHDVKIRTPSSLPQPTATIIVAQNNNRESDHICVVYVGTSSSSSYGFATLETYSEDIKEGYYTFFDQVSEEDSRRLIKDLKGDGDALIDYDEFEQLVLAAQVPWDDDDKENMFESWSDRVFGKKKVSTRMQFLNYVNATVGCGMVALPYIYIRCGLVLALVFTLLSCGLNIYVSEKVISLLEMTNVNRYDVTYGTLLKFVFGKIWISVCSVIVISINIALLSEYFMENE